MLGRLLPVTVLVCALVIVGLLYAGVSSSDAPSIEPIELRVAEGEANAMSTDEQQPRAEVAPAVSTPLQPTSPAGPVEGGG